MGKKSLTEIYNNNKSSESNFKNAASAEGYSDSDIATHWLSKTTNSSKTSNTKDTNRSLTNPIDVAKAMAKGVSSKSEMGGEFKVNMEGLTNYKTAASALQNEIFKQFLSTKISFEMLYKIN